MKKTRMIALSIPIAFLLLDFAMPASAMKPEVTVQIDHLEGTYADCGSYRIDYKGDQEWRMVTDFDNNGNPKTFQWYFKYDGIAWNTVSGLTVVDRTASHYMYDVATGVWKADGHFWHWTIPGRGLVLIEGGHVMLYPDHFEAHGRPHDLSGKSLQELCPILA